MRFYGQNSVSELPIRGQTAGQQTSHSGQDLHRTDTVEPGNQMLITVEMFTSTIWQECIDWLRHTSSAFLFWQEHRWQNNANVLQFKINIANDNYLNGWLTMFVSVNIIVHAPLVKRVNFTLKSRGTTSVEILYLYSTLLNSTT